MGKTFEGKLLGAGLRISIVIARFNDTIGRELLRGALDTLTRHGVAEPDIDTIWVPGAFEIPLAAKRLAESRRYDAVVTLGVVVRGATSHYEHVAGQAAAGITQATLSTGVPITFGVLTTETLEQAWERAGTKAGNKGADAALAAIEMANLLRDLPAVPPEPSHEAFKRLATKKRP